MCKNINSCFIVRAAGIRACPRRASVLVILVQIREVDMLRPRRSESVEQSE